MMIRKPALLPSSGNEAPSLVGPLDRAIFSHWYSTNNQLDQICDWEQIRYTGGKRTGL